MLRHASFTSLQCSAEISELFPSAEALAFVTCYIGTAKAQLGSEFLQANAEHLSAELPHIEGGSQAVLYPASTKAAGRLQVALRRDPLLLPNTHCAGRQRSTFLAAAGWAGSQRL